MKEQTTIVQVTTKDPKRIAAGKKLAEHNRKKREELAKDKPSSGTDSVHGTPAPLGSTVVLVALIGVAIMGGYVYKNYILQKQPAVIRSINQSISPLKVDKFEML